MPRTQINLEYVCIYVHVYMCVFQHSEKAVVDFPQNDYPTNQFFISFKFYLNILLNFLKIFTVVHT